MVEDAETQVGTSTRTKGGRKGKTTQVQANNDTTNKNELEVANNKADKEADSDSDFDNGNNWSVHVKSFLQSVPHAIKHLEGVYDKKHLKWSCTLNDALINALCRTIDTTREHNVNYLVLDVIKEYLTFHQVWRKIENRLMNKATKTSHRLALISQLDNIKMFHSDARKLIQEIWSIQTESSLLGKLFAINTLFLALQKCMIQHLVYKETVATIHQIDFNTLATALSICQTTIESIPAQKVNPRQASTRLTGNNDQDDQTGETKTDNNNMNPKNTSRP
ncbi:hypothetical protein NDA10_000703 [Ustilago hordei]|nr:hypothetical protein NDA10_000703 [Ustilago hordei]UTT89845.1 hypothetical protein NDA17_005454 [Ustilago hordei]